jgi:hypothetical protein
VFLIDSVFRLTERCSDQFIETSRLRQFAKSRRLPNAPASPAQFAVISASIRVWGDEVVAHVTLTIGWIT